MDMASIRSLLSVCQIWMIFVAAQESSGEEPPLQEMLEADYRLNRGFLDTLTGAYEIVYPQQVRRNVPLGISTRDHKIRHRNAHFHHTSFTIHMQGKRYKLKLELNTKLFGRKIKNLHHLAADTQMMSEEYVNHCFYHGKIKRMQESFVAVSTCAGLRGVIRMKNETYTIQPLKVFPGNEELNITQRNPHVVFQSQQANGLPCATDLGQWEPYQTLHKGEYLRRMKIYKSSQAGAPFIPKTRPIRLALVLDHSVAAQLNFSHVNMFDYAKQVANLIDMYMRQLHVRVTLVYTEMWNMREQFPVNSLVRDTLQKLLVYTTRSPAQVELDTVQLITLKQFAEKKVGMAIPESICTSRAVGVSRVSSLKNLLEVAAVVSHMIAHNLGVGHIKPGDCGCTKDTGCIMPESVLDWSGAGLPNFSTCSQQQLVNTLLHAGLGSCLLDDEKVSYPQTCGNGKLERGEECDCGSEEECYLKDPCCNPKICLLKPWATCRYGECCYNCTVMPEDFICRQAVTQCDVPEFCNGISGECPADELILDGQSCAGGASYCYHGQCNSHKDQCHKIWGEGATKADRKCFENYNSAGSFNGHCGWDPAAGKYIKCHADNLECGVLQCAGGSAKPNISKDKIFAMTHVVADESQYQCKIIHDKTNQDPLTGMVKDGTQCGMGRICLNQTCVSVELLGPQVCPRGQNGLTCSGKGVCTTAKRCFCERPYFGPDCSIRRNLTTTMYPPTTMPHDTVGNILIGGPTTKSRQASVTNGSAADVLVKRPEEKMGTMMWMIIVLAGVVGGCVLLLSFCFLCYRRRSPGNFVYSYKKKKWFGKQLPRFTWDKHEDSFTSQDAANRIISFGNLPSYRDEKMKELQKQQQRLIKGLSQMSGSGSEQGQQDLAAEIAASLSFPLASPPERGILKKHSRSADRSPRRSRTSLYQESAVTSPRASVNDPHLDRASSNDNLMSDSGHSDTATQTSPEGVMPPPHLNIPPPPPPTSLSMYGLKPLPPVNPVEHNSGESASSPDANIEEEHNSDDSIQKEELSDYEQESDFEKDPADFESGSDQDEAESFCTECQREREEQELLEMAGDNLSIHSQETASPNDASESSHGSKCSIGKNLNSGATIGAKKMKNLDDLFRELDEHIHESMKSSPAESEPLTDSLLQKEGTEKSVLPDNFFQSSDIEDGSPVNVRNSYMSCISPEPLCSPVLPVSPGAKSSASIVSPNTPSCVLTPDGSEVSPTKCHHILAQNLTKRGPSVSSPGSSESGSPSPTKQGKFKGKLPYSQEGSYSQYHKGPQHKPPPGRLNEGQFPHPYSSVRSLGRSPADRPNALPITKANKPTNPKKTSPVTSTPKSKASPGSPKKLGSPSRKQGSLERMRLTRKKSSEQERLKGKSAHSVAGSQNVPSKADTQSKRPLLATEDDKFKPREESPPGYFMPADHCLDSSGETQSVSEAGCSVSDIHTDDNLSQNDLPPTVSLADANVKVTNPLYDGYPLCKRHSSVAHDSVSNSEGYHSDKAELDDTIVIQDIPLTDADISSEDNRVLTSFGKPKLQS